MSRAPAHCSRRFRPGPVVLPRHEHDRLTRAYTYNPSGSLLKDDQSYYALTYTYDGAGQLTGEVSSGTYAPASVGYTYDHNGNRLTQTSNGVLAQSFTYDAHDKLTSGSAYNETDGYDLNGNETTVTINGGIYHDTYEDRLVSLAVPGGPTDTFVYNGLGLRVGKTDSTGTYSYLCDGTSPASPVLTDGHAVYTPGLSDNRGRAIHPADKSTGLPRFSLIPTCLSGGLLKISIGYPRRNMV